MSINQPFAWRRTLLISALTVAISYTASSAPPSEREPTLNRALPRVSVAGNKHTDNATARARWQSEWYNEAAYVETKGSGQNSVSPFNIQYRQFLMKAAEKERSKWAKQMPAQDSYKGIDATLQFAPASGNNWINIGPTKADVIKNGGTSLAKTDAGRVRAIIVHPTNNNIIYGAFSGGGVWKTSDGGANWAPLTDTLGSLSVGAISLDPNNSNTLYLGLGDPFDGTGIGVVKSTDAGVTWSSPVFLGDSTSVTSIAVAPSNSSIILVSTNAGLYRSTNGGSSYSLVSLSTGQSATPYVWSLAHAGGNSFVVSLEANKAAASGTTDGQIHYSSDNGATWSKATGVTKTSGVGRISLASAPSTPTKIYAMAAVPNATTSSDLADIFVSTNAGQTWTAKSANTKRYTKTNTESRDVKTLLNGQGWYNHLVIVDPTNANTAYFGGALLLAKTTDSGSTYTQKTNWLAQFSLPYVHADFHAATMTSNGTLFVGSDGGIFKSTDGGTTFSDALNIGLATHLIYSVGSSLNNPNAVIGGFQDNGTRVRSGSTSTFNQYLGGDGFGSDVNRSNANQMLGSLYYSRIYKSTNGGSTFTSACSGITECNNSSSAPFNTGIVSWQGDASGNTVFTWANLKAYKSTNYATSWTALGTSGLPTTSFAIRGLGVDPSNVNRLGLVASGGRVFLSTNGGSTWTQTSALPNNGLSMSSVAFDPSNANVVYVTSVAADATKTHAWKSNDFGVSWSAIDGNGFPTGVPVNNIELDPGSSSTLYAGTHLGVYRSNDSGATWSRFGNGLPLVNVTDVYVSPDSSLVRASTFGRGFWQLTP